MVGRPASFPGRIIARRRTRSRGSTFLVLALLSFPCGATRAQNAEVAVVRAEPVEPDGRFHWFRRWRSPSAPRWGLALGGGGTWGIAHLGVLRALREDGLAPRMIAGTSAGALAGAAVASGLEPADVREVLRDAERDPRRSIFAPTGTPDAPPDPVASRNAMGRAGRSSDGRRPPWRGLLPQDRVAGALARFLAAPGARAEGDFDRLPIPFRAVTTDVDAGAVYAPRHGSLIDLVLASVGIPVFPPVRTDGRRLIDGGVLAEVPVATVREMGADLVVGVRLTRNGDVGDPPPRRLNFRRLSRLYDRMTLEAYRRQGHDTADVPIAVALGDISAVDFRGRIDHLIESGRRAWASQRERVLRALERAATGPREHRVASVVASVETDPSAAAELARALRLDEGPRDVSALRLELWLAQRLNRGRERDGRIEIDDAGRAHLFLTRRPVVTRLHVDAPGLERYFFDLAPTILDQPTAPRVVAEIQHRLVRARREGHFLASIDAVRWDERAASLAVDVSPGTIGGIEVVSDQDGTPLATPRALDALLDGPANLDRLLHRLALLETEEALRRPRIRDVRRSGPGRFDVVLAVEPEPRWELGWSVGLADGLGATGWLRAAVPRAFGSWAVDTRLVAGREGLLVAGESRPPTTGPQPFVRIVAGRPALPLYDARGSFRDERRFDYAELAGGVRSGSTRWGRIEAALLMRAVSENAFLVGGDTAEGVDVGLQVRWSGRVGDDPFQPLRAFGWHVGGSLPVGGEDRAWVGAGDLTFDTPLGSRRRWSLALSARAADTGDSDPAPIDRWAEAGSWREAPRLSPGQSRAASVRRATVTVRRELGSLVGIPLRVGASAAAWRVGRERADPALPRQGRGASLFAELRGFGPLGLVLGVSTADFEGDSVYLLFGSPRVPWPGPLATLPGRGS